MRVIAAVSLTMISVFATQAARGAESGSDWVIAPESGTNRLMYATVRIETDRKDGAGPSYGTGFFFEIKTDDDRKIPLIVTCKHVIEKAETGKFELHAAREGKAEPSPEMVAVELDHFAKYWVGHPDPNVDLCAMAFHPIASAATKQNQQPFVTFLTEDNIPPDAELRKLQAAEVVLMVGYPIGLYDHLHNYPLFRRGTTSSHPAVDFEGQPLTAVDIACFPGSSGSPVMLVTKPDKAEGNRIWFLGVLFAAPVVDVAGDIKSRSIPTEKAPPPGAPYMINLGYVVKSREMRTLADQIKKIALEPKDVISPPASPSSPQTP